MVPCPECETNLDVDVEEIDEGELISCPECGTDFEVVTTSPLELTGAYAASANDGTFCTPAPVVSITNQQGQPVTSRMI